MVTVVVTCVCLRTPRGVDESDSVYIVVTVLWSPYVYRDREEDYREEGVIRRRDRSKRPKRNKRLGDLYHTGSRVERKDLAGEGPTRVGGVRTRC